MQKIFRLEKDQVEWLERQKEKQRMDQSNIIRLMIDTCMGKKPLSFLRRLNDGRCIKK